MRHANLKRQKGRRNKIFYSLHSPVCRYGLSFSLSVSRPRFLNAAFPITRTAFHVHHRQNPDAVGLLDVNHRIRKDGGKMPLRGRVKMAEAFRVAADSLNQPLHLVVKTSAEFRVGLRIIFCGLRVFIRRFGMERVRFQRPTILRMRRLTTSPGTA